MNEVSMDLDIINDTNPLAALPEELQRKIKEHADKVTASCSVNVNRIPNRAKGFMLPDGKEVQSFTGIIVGHLHANMHYKGAYVKGKPNSLDCFAYSVDLENEDLVPASEVVGRYAPSCKNCSKRKWDSGTNGRGKACGEHTCLAVYVPQLGEDLYVIDMKKGNCDKVAKPYLRNTVHAYGTPMAVYTRFSMGEKTDWTAAMTAGDRVQPNILTYLAGRMEEAHEILVERVSGSYGDEETVVNDDDPNAPTPKRK